MKRQIIWLMATTLLGCGTSSGSGSSGFVQQPPAHDTLMQFADAGASSGGASSGGASSGGASSSGASSGGASSGGPCAPSCQKKVCGDDGCGGTCGDCPQGTACMMTGCEKLAPADVCKAANCDPNAYCVEQDGKPTCACKVGWVGNGYSCVDENECKTNNGNCPANSLCENQVGAPRVCKCAKGYEGNGYICNDIDECKSDTAKCPEHSSCQNTKGSYDCTCDKGFAAAGSKGCGDIDECKTGVATCGANAHCSNTLGSYVCSCDKGFQKVNGACADVNECAEGLSDCDKNASCTNTVGAFTCACKPGYEGDGKVCGEKDLCKETNCHSKAVCKKNAKGLPTCVCNPGYDGDGKACYPAVVNITFSGAIIRPRPSQQSCWDPGCSITPEQAKAVIDAAAAAAAAFKGNPYITAATYAAKILPLDKALAGIAGKTSKPDAMGTVSLLPGGPAKKLASGGTADNTLTPLWSDVVFSNVTLTSLTGLQVQLVDNDIWPEPDDPIGQVKVSSSMLVKALQIGKSVPLPTADQGSGDILFVIAQVDQAQKCGDYKCAGTETASNCSLDCGGGNNTTSNGGTCKGFCGKYDKSWKCQCDSQCKQYNDCCPDLQTVCP